MDSVLQEELYNNYPNLFFNKDKGPRESCMYFGIEAGSGWFDIISTLCYEINQYEQNITNDKSCRYNKNYVPVKFDQVKQKFGGLRVYFSGGDDFIDGLVNMAEAISYKTCESCGNSGKPNKEGWIATLCESCRHQNLPPSP